MGANSWGRLALGGWVLSTIAALCAVGGEACAKHDDDADSQNGDLSAGESDAIRTLNDLAGFGEKRVGTPEGAKASQYVMGRMQQAGLKNVHFEQFNFPQHLTNLAASSFQVTQNGKPFAGQQIAFDVFEGSGTGSVKDAALIFVGSAKPEDLQGKDLKGKIAFVKRDSEYHRSSQYRNVAKAGAVAMLYESAVPDNQIQIGSIRETWEAMGPIPTITIGSDDGDNLKANVASLRASITVSAKNAHGTGQNVVGIIPGQNFGKVDASGKSLDHQIVFGAHYDTWYIGSTDNGCGVAALLGLAQARANPAVAPPYTLVFVAFDGEEVALYGGYDYLRKHQNEGVLAVVNFEIPAAETDILAGGFETLVSGVATSQVSVIEDSLQKAEAVGPFTAFAVDLPLDKVARMFGGIIPTDIQGWFRSGVPTVTTASSTPWYHTKKDTPDKVDTSAVARTVRAFSRTTDQLLSKPLEQYNFLDGSLWRANLDVVSGGTKEPQVLVKVDLADAKGNKLPNTSLTGTFFCDDFFAAPDKMVQTDAQGTAFLTFKDELKNCQGRRWVHVTAGPDYPHVEKIVSLPSP
jgi:hypothetical protein